MSPGPDLGKDRESKCFFRKLEHAFGRIKQACTRNTSAPEISPIARLTRLSIPYFGAIDLEVQHEKKPAKFKKGLSLTQDLKQKE